MEKNDSDIMASKRVFHYPGYMFIVYDSCLRFFFLKFDNLDFNYP
ncbi:MAG: hypothetical protein Ct9H300mP21_03310 [Pseudomonadota bacterium]|nr:MAG: hypothetical protein Ct9H300mP21_03310 [Pseudomonadota bacterium]